LFFDRSLQAWGGADFEAILKQEIAQLGADHLPLQQGLSSSNYVADGPITVMIHNVAELENVLRIRVGILYQGIISGCSCADDPTPISENNEYCELQIDINMISAATSIRANGVASQ
jgi:hypothetical protein